MFFYFVLQHANAFAGRKVGYRIFEIQPQQLLALGHHPQFYRGAPVGYLHQITLNTRFSEQAFQFFTRLVLAHQSHQRAAGAQAHQV